jgi:hypothetical protein
MNTRTLMRALRGIVDQEHNPFPFQGMRASWREACFTYAAAAAT